jgi:hypothetical protein
MPTLIDRSRSFLGTASLRVPPVEDGRDDMEVRDRLLRKACSGSRCEIRKALNDEHQDSVSERNSRETNTTRGSLRSSSPQIHSL